MKGLAAGVAALLAFSIVGCSSDTPTPSATTTTTTTTTDPTTAAPTTTAPKIEIVSFVNARLARTPATVVIPDGDGPFPLVVLAHGHGGSREENIGFAAIAEGLRLKGIASIRMDFPGCGDSTESFQENTLTNMKSDVIDAIAYAKENYPIDATKVGFFGYSMGGRIGLEMVAAEMYDFQALAFLAPAASTHDLKALFGGEDAYNTMRTTAEADGFVTYTTIYGQTQELSKQWFADLDTLPAGVENFAAAHAKLSGPVVVIFGQDDNAVSPSVSQAVADTFGAISSGSTIVDATGDTHSYGFYSDQTDILNTVVNAVADCFSTAFGTA
jgi:pimeloyl-ACP methyl ester carboxylesterase